MNLLFRLMGRLSLRANHRLGALLGWLAWWFSPRHGQQTRENIARYCAAKGILDGRKLIRASIAEQGKGFSELAIAWTAPLDKIYALVRDCRGWEHVDAAKKNDRAIIFVTPHLGCFDIAGRYVESRVPMTAMYRPPKIAALEPIMQRGRVRGGATTANANAGGVRTLLKTLKAGGNILLLPDQVPAPAQGGDGEWADFFGAPAYTMTLLPRLQRASDAVVLFFFAERLADGAGYRVHILPMLESYSEDRAIAARQTNAMVETLVSMAPEQYLWSYNRYKHPAGAAQRPGNTPQPGTTSSRPV